MKKSVEDAERASSCVSALTCLILFAGAIVFSAEKTFSVPAHEAAEEIAENGPVRIAVRLKNFVPVPEISKIENAPEETPSAPENPVAPELPKEKSPKESPAPDKINETALREVSEVVPVPEETPSESEELPKPEAPREKPQDFSLSQREQQVPPSLPVSVSVENAAAKIAAEKTLYGALADAIRREKFYPRAARRSGYAGTVSLRVEIDEGGKIKTFEVTSSSAHYLLQAGAMRTLRRVAEKFSAPSGTHSVLPSIFIVPIVYELN